MLSQACLCCGDCELAWWQSVLQPELPPGRPGDPRTGSTDADTCEQAAASPGGLEVCLGAGYGHDPHHVQHTTELSLFWQSCHVKLAADILLGRHTGQTVSDHLILSGHSGMLQLVAFCNRK